MTKSAWLAAMVVFLVGALLGGPAGAQTYPPTTPPVAPVGVAPEEVAPGEVAPQEGGAPAVGGVQAAEEEPALAFTGADLTLLVLVLIALTTVGAFALIVARRRAVRATDTG
jgi:hypothetical protein